LLVKFRGQWDVRAQKLRDWVVSRED